MSVDVVRLGLEGVAALVFDYLRIGVRHRGRGIGVAPTSMGDEPKGLGVSAGDLEGVFSLMHETQQLSRRLAVGVRAGVLEARHQRRIFVDDDLLVVPEHPRQQFGGGGQTLRPRRFELAECARIEWVAVFISQ